MMPGLWRRLLHGTRLAEEEADWARLVGEQWPESIMDMPVTDRFHAKQGRSTGRLTLKAPNGDFSVYLKRHYRLPRWQGVLATIWPRRGWSPAMAEKQNLKWARQKGFLVPRTVAVSEFIGPWGRLQSALAVEELKGMLPLHEIVPLAQKKLEPTAFRQWKRSLTQEMARVTRRLHQCRAYHKDLYLCHYYLPETLVRPAAGLENHLYLIDFHRLTHQPLTWVFGLIKDLGQLLYSSYEIGVDRRDRLLFWRFYMGTARRSWFGRMLRLTVNWRAARYLRHNQKRLALAAALSTAEPRPCGIDNHKEVRESRKSA